MISISFKRYGELVGAAVRVSELEQELARMAKNFEMQTNNVLYWKSVASSAEADIRAHEEILREKDKRIAELEGQVDSFQFKYNDALNELFKWQAAFIEAEIKLNAKTVELGNLKFRHSMAIEASERILKTYTNLGKPGAE